MRRKVRAEPARGSIMNRSVYQQLSVLAARSVWLHASKLTRLRHFKNGIVGNIWGTSLVYGVMEVEGEIIRDGDSGDQAI
jgi:hypothetical protein